MPEKIVVFGAGGHAKVVIDAIECGGRYEVAFLADADPARVGSTVFGYPVKAEEDGFTAATLGIRSAFVAIGSNVIRHRVAGKAKDMGLTLATLVHPRALVAESAVIGAGTVVMPGSIVNPDAVIGGNAIINSGAVVEHDCVVGDDAHIGPNATLCGGVTVGIGCLIGAGATVLIGIRVGEGAVVGAGSTVIDSVPDRARAVGSPCRILEERV